MFRSILRSVTRNPAFTAAAVLTLALGIGANTAMFSIIDGVLLKPLAYRQPDRLISLHLRITTLKNLGVLPLPPYIYKLWRRNASTIESIAVIRPGSDNLTGVGEPDRLLSARVSSSVFQTLGVWPAIGRSFTESEDTHDGPKAVILSDGLWRRRFAADPKVLGRAIQLNETPYTIIGVMPAGFEVPIDLETEHAAHFDIMLPVAFAPDNMMNHGYWGVARLKPGVTLDQARTELDTILATIKGDLVRNAVAAPLETNLTARVRQGLGLLMAAVGLVLLIACGNLANLMLSRGLARRKEIAVRSALGASRWQIVRLLFNESLALSALGGVAGVICASWSVSAILAQLPASLPHQGAISVDPRSLLFCLAATFFSALLFGALPAWRFSKADPQEALQQAGRGASETRKSSALRQCLIGTQVALGTMLVIGCGLVLRSFANVARVDPGFETHNVITADLPLEGPRYTEPAIREAYREIEQRLSSIPGVTASGGVSWLPLSGNEYQNPIFFPGQALTRDRIADLPMAQIRFATPGYFQAAGVTLESGRVYSEAAGEMWSAVVSESAARRLWPSGSPLGQEFTIDEGPKPRVWRVAGVVADVRQAGLESPAPMIVYLPPANNRGMSFSFVLRTKMPPDSLTRSIRQAVWQVDPAIPVPKIRSMSEIVATAVGQRRFQTLLLTAFAGAALLLAALGIYGTISYSVNQRYREIGIRLALGAQSRDIGTLVLRHALTPVIAGLVAGAIGALCIRETLAALLYGISASDAPTYAASGALFLLVAAVSCWWPARRATRLDPVETMRCE